MQRRSVSEHRSDRKGQRTASNANKTIGNESTKKCYKNAAQSEYTQTGNRGSLVGIKAFASTSGKSVTLFTFSSTSKPLENPNLGTTRRPKARLGIVEHVLCRKKECGEHLLSTGDDLVGREDEAVLASVTELNAIRELGTKFGIGPVGAAAARGIDGGRNGTIGERSAVDGLDGLCGGGRELVLDGEVLGLVGSVSPRRHPELRIAVEVNVSLDVALCLDVGGNRLDLNLAECAGALVVLGARVGACTSLAPVLIPVPVGVHTGTARACVGRSSLAPHAVGRVGVHISVGVEDGEDCEFNGIDKTGDVGVVSVLGEEVADGIDIDGCANPFAGVDASVKPEARLGAGALAGDLDGGQSATLVRRSNIDKLGNVRVGLHLLLQPRVNLVKCVVCRVEVIARLQLGCGEGSIQQLLDVIHHRRVFDVKISKVSLECAE
eukprot:Opistho-2@91432